MHKLIANTTIFHALVTLQIKYPPAIPKHQNAYVRKVPIDSCMKIVRGSSTTEIPNHIRKRTDNRF